MSAKREDDAVTATSMRPRSGLLGRLLDRLAPRPTAGGLPPRIGRYRVIELLGEGGMGRVFLGEDQMLQRRVAVKTLKQLDRRSQRRFLREARAAARVSHPNVCSIFEVGREGGQLFLATELLSGETLAKRLERGPLPEAEALAMARDLLAALGALHGAGIVHRDVKPSNVFLTGHGAKLLDFGLARDLPGDLAQALASGASDLTRPGLIIGTPGYMAPEQILGHPVDARADLFAVGVVLYEALAGGRPFRGASAVQVLSAILHEEPPALGLSRSLAVLDAPIRRALSKPPDQRYASAEAMAKALSAPARIAPADAKVRPPTPEPFVGREAELGWLQERLAAAVAGTGSVVFVTGERGVGKSTLISEFLRRVHSGAEPVSMVAGRCIEPQGPGEPFLPFLDALGRLLTSRARDVALELVRTYAPTVCMQMPAGLIDDPDGSLQRQTVGATKERLIREAGDFIEAASRFFPIVIYLEDLQWADTPSTDLLHHLGCRIARQRVLVVGAYRQADVDAVNPPMKRCALDLVARGVGRDIPLGPLSRDEIQACLEARFSPNRFSAPLADALHARTEGLALFVRSLVDLLQERGEILPDGESWTLARPIEELDLEPTMGLQDLVRQHLDALPREERELLQSASVAGREFLSPVVAHLVGVGDLEVEERLHRLCEVRRLIVDHGEEELPDGTLASRYRFARGLYPAVLYQDLVVSRRVQLHRQITERLRHHWGSEAPRLAVEIARHAELGRDFESAVTFRLHAGDNATQRFAYEEAAEQYDWASRLIEKLPPQGRSEMMLALYRKRGALRHVQARFDEAADDFRVMLQTARDQGRGEAERSALAGLCNALFFARRLDEMAVHAQELLDAATRAGHASGALEARSRLGQVLVCRGRFAEAVPLLDGVIDEARADGPPVALQIGITCRGLVHYWQAEYAAAEALMSEAAAIAADRGEAFDVLAARLFVGSSRVKLGRLSDGIREFLEAIALARRNGDRFWTPRLVNRMGWVHRELFALERAREFDQEALNLARAAPLTQRPETEALLDLAVDAVQLGHGEEASALLSELEARVSEGEWFRWMSELRLATISAEHWVARGDRDRAAAQAGRLLELAARLGARDYRCSAERIRAEAALARGEGLEQATQDLAAALAALDPFPPPLEVWKAARLLGQLHRRLGDEPKAGQAFTLAAKAVRTIAVGVTDEGLRAGFLAAGPVREVLEADLGSGRTPAGSSP